MISHLYLSDLMSSKMCGIFIIGQECILLCKTELDQKSSGYLTWTLSHAANNKYAYIIKNKKIKLF